MSTDDRFCTSVQQLGGVGQAGCHTHLPGGDGAKPAVTESAVPDSAVAAPGARIPAAPQALALDEQDPVVESALALLDPKDWEITRTPAFVTATRRWPQGWMDTLLVLHAQRTQGQRDNPLNRVVWQRFGAISEVAAELDALPEPGQPGAPVMPVPGRDEDMP